MSASGFLAKAQLALASAGTLARDGDTDGACSRAYFAMHHAALTALVPFDVPGIAESAQRRGELVVAFWRLLVEPGLISKELAKSFSKVEDLRMAADYKVEVVNAADARWAVSEAQVFVEHVQKLVEGKSTGGRTNVAQAWSRAVFDEIEWRRFEALCETLFGQAGFETRSQSHGADGGVDIWLHSANAQGPAAVVQCKHWHKRQVGVKELREFYGVMASHQLKRGTFATTSNYTSEALKFAKENGINALDGDALITLIGTRTPEQQSALLAVAYEGEHWRPTCASCGIKLMERTSTKDGNKFWGCSNYPRCKSRLPMTALQLQRMGAPVG